MLPRLRDNGNQRPGGRPKADREDPDSCGRRFLGGNDPTRLQILSISHEHKCPAASLPLAKRSHRHADGRGDVGAPLGDRIRIKILKGVQDSSLVEGQRSLKERISRKGDQPDPIPL